MKLMINYIAICIFLLPLGVLAEADKSRVSIMPENDMYIKEHDKNISSITEEDFNKVLDRIESIYNPILDDMGKRLKIVRKWSDGTVNAYANRMGNTWKIHMFGGLARHNVMTADGLALVACHELGHHLGGKPKTRKIITTWATNEGQSDYFSSSKCLRKYFEKDNNQDIVSRVRIDSEASKVCSRIFSFNEDIAICKRSSMAGLVVASLFRSFEGSKKVSFSTPDLTTVRVTSNRHPRAQCRLDTFFAGALCDKSHEEDFSKRDLNVGACTRINDYNTGIRPLCWFRPKRR